MCNTSLPVSIEEWRGNFRDKSKDSMRKYYNMKLVISLHITHVYIFVSSALLFQNSTLCRYIIYKLCYLQWYVKWLHKMYRMHSDSFGFETEIRNLSIGWSRYFFLFVLFLDFYLLYGFDKTCTFLFCHLHRKTAYITLGEVRRKKICELIIFSFHWFVISDHYHVKRCLLLSCSKCL